MSPFVTDLREMELRTWLALGARLNEQGTIEALSWQSWQAVRDELRDRQK